MSRRPLLSRRALLSIGGGCFAGSYLLDVVLADNPVSTPTGSIWHHRWTDATNRRFLQPEFEPGSLSQAWSATVEEPRRRVSVECIGPDRVFLRDYDRLLAYDRAGGDREWVYNTDEGLFSLPTLVSDLLVVQENSTVHVVDAASGGTLWTGRFQPPELRFSSVLARKGYIYLSDENKYYEVNPDTGFHRRTFDVKQLGIPTAASDSGLFWWLDGTLRLTDLSGTVQWTHTLGSALPSSGRSVAVMGETVVVRHRDTDAQSVVSALDIEGGDRLWEVRDTVDGGTTVTAGENVVYVWNGRTLAALEGESGAERWRLPSGQPTSSPVATPQTAYVPTTDGIRPLDPADGTERTQRLLDGRQIDSLAAVNGGIYAVSNNQLLALEGST